MAEEKYRLVAESAKYKDTYRVDILEDGYSGSMTYKNIGARKIKLSKSNGIIQKTTLDISIQSDTDFEYTGFMQYDNRKYPVQLYKNDILIWSGYHVAESYSEPYQNPPYDVDIVATDNLGLLETFKFDNPGRQSRLDAIIYCLNKTGLLLGFSIAIDFFESTMNTGRAMLEQVDFNGEIFQGETCDKVLEKLLPYGTIITQKNNRWLIRRPFDDSEKTHFLYDSSGTYTGTENGETLIQMGDYASGEIWPHGTPLLEMEHAWKDARIIADFGKRESFLENSDFSEGVENWTDNTGGNLVIKKPVMRRGEDASFNFYYAQINGYGPVATDHYIEQDIEIEQTTDDFIFECLFDVLAFRSTITTGAISSIEITVHMMISLGSFPGTIWFLHKEWGWQPDPTYIDLKINSTVGLIPFWKELRILAPSVPMAGTLSVKLFRIKYDDKPSQYTITGACFGRVKIYTDALLFSANKQAYDVYLKENAVQSNNTVELKPVDLPDIANSYFLFSNANYVGDSVRGTWQDNGGSAVSYIHAIANKLACYHKFLRHRISGCDWRGENMHLNAIAQHSKNNNRKFVVESGDWEILDDVFNCSWIEVAGSDTATPVEEDDGAPVAENAGSGVSPNPEVGHPPVTIATGSEAYLSITDFQELSINVSDLGNVQSDWNQADTGADDYIKNKPTIPGDVGDLTDIDDLLGDKNVQSDWEQTATGADDYIKNKPTITDELVKYDAADPTSGYLADKIIAGTNITIEEGTGADENKLVISATGGGGGLTCDNILECQSLQGAFEELYSELPFGGSAQGIDIDSLLFSPMRAYDGETSFHILIFLEVGDVLKNEAMFISGALWAFNNQVFLRYGIQGNPISEFVSFELLVTSWGELDTPLQLNFSTNSEYYVNYSFIQPPTALAY